MIILNIKNLQTILFKQPHKTSCSINSIAAAKTLLL